MLVCYIIWWGVKNSLNPSPEGRGDREVSSAAPQALQREREREKGSEAVRR
jgi:hypothetical protein